MKDSSVSLLPTPMEKDTLTWKDMQTEKDLTTEKDKIT